MQCWLCLALLRAPGSHAWPGPPVILTNTRVCMARVEQSSPGYYWYLRLNYGVLKVRTWPRLPHYSITRWTPSVNVRTLTSLSITLFAAMSHMRWLACFWIAPLCACGITLQEIEHRRSGALAERSETLSWCGTWCVGESCSLEHRHTMEYALSRAVFACQGLAGALIHNQ
jgi:hypothetical protein